MSTRAGDWLIDTRHGDTVRAFVPAPLPPSSPPIDLASLQRPLERATLALGRLDGVASILPDAPLFLYMYVRKEALLSSQIEGTQSSLHDLLTHEDGEAPGAPLDDVREVSNYVAAMEYGLERLRELPLSLRLIREIHERLMTSGRGAALEPGRFRTSQNRIGGTRPGNAAYVPPPPDRMTESLHDLEAFFHTDAPELPLLVRAGIAHVQFESIHPFLDGNGRLGRLLITFLLCAEKALSQPILYLSLYLKTHRSTYYDLLQRVRERGDWEAWLAFFLDGVAETSTQAADTAQEILALFAHDRKRIEEALNRGASSPLRVHELLQRKPSVSVASAGGSLELSAPTIRGALEQLEALGMVHESTGRKRDRRYVYTSYLDILSRGTEPL